MNILTTWHDQFQSDIERARVAVKHAQAGLLTANKAAEFAQQSPENEKLIQPLLANEASMVQMLVAAGPASGKFGKAMKIYRPLMMGMISVGSAKAQIGGNNVSSLFWY